MSWEKVLDKMSSTLLEFAKALASKLIMEIPEAPTLLTRLVMDLITLINKSLAVNH